VRRRWRCAFRLRAARLVRLWSVRVCGPACLGECMKGVQAVPERLIRVRIEMAIAIQGEADRGVPGPSGDLLGIRPGRNPQRHGRMPQVVNAQPIQPGRSGRRRQMRCRNPTSCNVPPCGPINTRSSADPGWPSCSAKASTTTRGSPDTAVASSGLGRPEMQVAADLGDDLHDLDHPVLQVDSAARWATPGPHSGHRRPDRSGQQRSPPDRRRPSSASISPTDRRSPRLSCAP
jgi:hypothetical protein